MIAEGLRSRTRDLIWPESPIDETGLYIAYSAIPRAPSDNDRWRIMACGQGRVAMLRPDNRGTTRVFLNFLSNTRGLARLPRAEVVALVS